MTFRLILASGLVALASGTAADSVPTGQHKTIYGVHEHARINELDLGLEAKLDTGAVSASLSAYDIETFERDGEDWVRFRVGVKSAGDKAVELPLDHTVRIRRRVQDLHPEAEKTYTQRPVVSLTLCVGDRAATMRVNLTDRRNFDFPLLIGSEGLAQLHSIIDPQLSYSVGTPSCNAEPVRAAQQDRS